MKTPRPVFFLSLVFSLTITAASFLPIDLPTATTAVDYHQRRLSQAEVARIANRDFRAADVPAVLRTIGEYGPDEAEQHRVQLGIMKLAGGEVARLEDLVTSAVADFRDILGPAEYPLVIAALSPDGGYRNMNEIPPHRLARLESRDWEQYSTWFRR